MLNMVVCLREGAEAAECHTWLHRFLCRAATLAAQISYTPETAAAISPRSVAISTVKDAEYTE